MKVFPVDYTAAEIRSVIVEINQKLDSDNTSLLSEGERIELNEKMRMCQNQLLSLSLIESNKKIEKQQELLNFGLESFKKSILSTARRARIMIILAILSVLINIVVGVVNRIKHKGEITSSISVSIEEIKQLEESILLKLEEADSIK